MGGRVFDGLLARPSRLWSAHENWRADSLVGWSEVDEVGLVHRWRSTSCYHKWRWKRDEKEEGAWSSARWKYEIWRDAADWAATEVQNKRPPPAPSSHHTSKYLCHSYSKQIIFLIVPPRTTQSLFSYSMNRDSLFSSNVRLLNFTFPSIFKLRSFKAVHCKQVQPDQLNKLAAFAFLSRFPPYSSLYNPCYYTGFIKLRMKWSVTAIKIYKSIVLVKIFHLTHLYKSIQLTYVPSCFSHDTEKIYEWKSRTCFTSRNSKIYSQISHISVISVIINRHKSMTMCL